VIETLNDDSQILLLYLADELPDQDRLAIDRRLATEPLLSEELKQLSSMYGQIGARLQEADEFRGGRFPVNVNTTAHSIGRLMRQRLAEPRPIVAISKQPARSRVRPWLIPSGIAAAILVASAVWINRGKLEDHKQIAIVVGPTTNTTHPSPLPTDENLDLFKDSFTPPNHEIADVLNSGSAQKDLSMQDDVSPYLLKVGTVQE